MKKIYPILTLLLVLSISQAEAQSWKQKLKEMKDRVEAKVDRQQKQVDARYAEHLKRVWEKAEFVPAEDLYSLPKPDQLPIYDPTFDLTFGDEEFDFDIFPTNPDAANDRPDFEPITPSQKPQPRVRMEEIEEDQYNEIPSNIPAGDFRGELSNEQLSKLNRQAVVDFFGSEFPLYYNSRIGLDFRGRLNESLIGDAWSQLDNAEHELVLYQFVRIANAQNLNDWGYCQLLNSAAKQLYPNDINAQTMFNLFFLSKSGYVVGVSYHANRMHLMFPSLQTIYGTTFLRGKNYKYYIVDLNGNTPKIDEGRVFNKTYPNAERIINFRFFQAPKLQERIVKRNLNFEYKGRDYEVPVSLNKNLVNFYATYPFTDLDVQLTTPLSDVAYKSLIPSLKRIVSGMSETEAVNLLLRFSQTAFEYETDEKQFGMENYLFAEETLYYPASDCEDRSVLFAYLVQEILNLDVVGLIFPGHAATAVRFSENLDGDFITFRGQKYMICDPTYIDASYGTCMPEVRNKDIKVVDF